jgi:2-oxoglutarate ferredoxin oxidoreductase subunit gamma
VIVVNTSLINRLPHRTDVTVVAVPANEVAIECGSPKAANMVTLGAYLGASGVVELDQVKAIVTESFAAKPKLVEVNHAALSRGFAFGQAKTAAAVR